MPLSTEFVTNKPLTGPELVTSIVNDTQAVLEKDGMFNSHVAYGKVSYTVTIRLQMANPTYPEHVVRVIGQGLKIEDGDQIEEVEVSRGREIKSPNAVRIANQIPVKVQTRQDGRVVEKELKYAGEVRVPPQPEPVDKVERIK